MKSRILLTLSITSVMWAITASPLTACQSINSNFTFDYISGLTAALVNPTTTVTGPVNASGCDIGVYYDTGSGKVDHADIEGATMLGVVVNGDASNVSVDITNSTINQTGNNPLNGVQYGVAIYYRAFFLGGSASGTISGNTITNYQKGGIVANGQGTSVEIMDNTVTGQGAVDYIAQNGIQVGYGANASVMRNAVTGNSYTGTNDAASGGILVVGGPGYGTCPDGNPCPYTVGTRIVGNTVTGNDVGVWLSNAGPYPDYPPPTSATNIKVVNNIISDSALTNVSGSLCPGGVCVPYQAGISDEGNKDKLINNNVSGPGYDPTTDPGYTYDIDTGPSYSPNVKVHADVVDGVRSGTN